MHTVLGLDLGTQSVKAVFYDYEKRTIVASAASPLEVDRDREGKAEQQAHWWLKALSDCMQQVSEEIRMSVQALAVSGQQHGFVPLDAKGKVLTPVKLWCDTATQAEADQLTRNCGGRHQAIALTGNPVLTGYTAAKILWLKNHHPGIYAQMTHILLPHDYLNFVLTGEYTMEFGDASGTGLLDVRNRQWSRDMLKALDSERDLAACLPPIYEQSDVIGQVSAEAATLYGLPAGIPVATGGGDNMMGAIGTGNVSPGKLTISLGSSGTLYASSDTPVIDPGGHIAAFCSSTGGWLPLLCTMNCTLSTELIRQPLNIPLGDFDALASMAPAGSGGLIMLPFFNGERTPDLPRAKASLFGLDPHNCNREHILRATIEATCYSLKFGLDSLQRLGLHSTDVVLTGGGSKSSVWRQVIADVFNLPVTILKIEEGASFGAALQALYTLMQEQGEAVSIAELCSIHLEADSSRCVTPDVNNVELYADCYQRYNTLLSHFTPLLEGRM